MEYPPPERLTVAEANRRLPEVRAALADVQVHLAEMRALVREIAQIEAVGRTATGRLVLAADHRADQEALDRHRHACETIIARLAGLGCMVKDLDLGICDFHGLVAGRPVLLCWRQGEPGIAFYHAEDDGYAGRKPIPPGTP